MKPKPLLSDDEGANFLQMSRRKAVRLARKGKIPCVILPDGQVRFIEDELVAFVERCKSQPTRGRIDVDGKGVSTPADA